jgi:hypothetical protein
MRQSVIPDLDDENPQARRILPSAERLEHTPNKLSAVEFHLDRKVYANANSTCPELSSFISLAHEVDRYTNTLYVLAAMKAQCFYVLLWLGHLQSGECIARRDFFLANSLGLLTR